MSNLIVKASLKFLKETHIKIYGKASKITDALIAKAANYPSVSPKPADFLPILVDYKKYIVAADGGGRTDRAKRNEYGVIVADRMRSWAPQVTFDCNGNLTLLDESGFDNIKQRTPAEISIPRAPEVSDGVNTGSAKLRVKAVRGANSYQFRYSEKDPLTATDADYVLLPPSTTRVFTENQTSGKKYFFSCRASGASGVSSWSEPSLFMVR